LKYRAGFHVTLYRRPEIIKNKGGGERKDEKKKRAISKERYTSSKKGRRDRWNWRQTKKGG